MYKCNETVRTNIKHTARRKSRLYRTNVQIRRLSVKDEYTMNVVININYQENRQCTFFRQIICKKLFRGRKLWKKCHRHFENRHVKTVSTCLGK